MSEYEGVDAPPAAATSPSAEEKQWAVFAHLAALSAPFTSGLGWIVGPLVIWLIKKDTMPFVDYHGKEALNFNITMLIVSLVSFFLGVIALVFCNAPLFFVPSVVITIVWLVLTIIAIIKASKGEYYRYPFTFRWLR